MGPTTDSPAAFGLSPAQRTLGDAVYELSRRHVAPRAAGIDESGEYPEDIFQLLKSRDLLGLYVPEEYGGAGLGILETCVAIEQMARFCSNSPLFFSVHLLATRGVAIGGTEAQKNTWLRGVARGEMRPAFSLTEPQAGSDAANISTRAERDGDSWLINGQKCYCTGASVADFLTVAAKTEPDKGARGVSFFIVPAGEFQVGRRERKMGMRGIPTCEVFLENARVPQENMIGEQATGFRTAMLGFNQARPAIGARGVGLAQGCLDYAARYAGEREAFGKPVSRRQAVQFMLADMFMDIEASRLLVYRAASMVDNGRHQKEDAHFICAAKCCASDAAMKVAVDAVQVLGEAGCTKDHPLERFMRDAKQLQIIEGTNQIQRAVIARNLLNLN